VVDGLGGSLMSVPSGILNAICTNIGAALIIRIIPFIRFHNSHTRIVATVISIFIISYINSGLIPIYLAKKAETWMPPILTPDWLLFYEKMIVTSLVT
jgi:hypothetical protein